MKLLNQISAVQKFKIATCRNMSNIIQVVEIYSYCYPSCPSSSFSAFSVPEIVYDIRPTPFDTRHSTRLSVLPALTRQSIFPLHYSLSRSDYRRRISYLNLILIMFKKIIFECRMIFTNKYYMLISADIYSKVCTILLSIKHWHKIAHETFKKMNTNIIILCLFLTVSAYSNRMRHKQKYLTSSHFSECHSVNLDCFWSVCALAKTAICE